MLSQTKFPTATEVFVAKICPIHSPSTLALSQASSYNDTTLKNQSIAAWSLLEHCLKNKGIILQPQDIAKTENGKPYLKTNNQIQMLHFSLSHSHNMVAVAISNKPVGVDIELIMPHPILQSKMDLSEFCRREADIKRLGGTIGQIKKPPQNQVFQDVICCDQQKYYLSVSCDDVKNITVFKKELGGLL